MSQPFGLVIPPQLPTTASHLTALMGEQAQADADRAMIRELQNSQRDQIGEQFGGRYYKTHYLFWSLKYKGLPIEVTRYYPDRAVAVDIFKDFGEEEKQEINAKRRILNVIGIRYCALSEATSELSDVVAQVGLGG